MNTFVLESEDLDFLMSEECQMFMYEAAPQVKESFFKRVITKIKAMLQKISDFITSATTKKQAEKIKKVVDANPQLGNKKVKIEDYQEAYKLGKSALKKLEKAKTKEEADKIVAQYKRNRVIKTVTISVAALATLVAGGKLFARAKDKMFMLNKFVKDTETVQDMLLDQISHGHSPETTKMLNNFLDKTKKEREELLAKQKSASIIGFMVQDLRDQVMKPFHTLTRSTIANNSDNDVFDRLYKGAKEKQKVHNLSFKDKKSRA